MYQFHGENARVSKIHPHPVEKEQTQGGFSVMQRNKAESVEARWSLETDGKVVGKVVEEVFFLNKEVH